VASAKDDFIFEASEFREAQFTLRDNILVINKAATNAKLKLESNNSFQQLNSLEEI